MAPCSSRLRAAGLLLLALLVAALAPAATAFLLPSPHGSGDSRAAAGRIAERRWQGQQQQQMESRLTVRTERGGDCAVD